MGHPILIIGDFNVICYGSKKMGGKAFRNNVKIVDFQNFIFFNSLVDLSFSGSSFT